MAAIGDGAHTDPQIPCETCRRPQSIERLLLCPCERVVYCSADCYAQHMRAGHELEHATLIGPPKPGEAGQEMGAAAPLILDFNNRLEDAARTRKDFAELLRKLYPPAYYPYKVRHQETAIQPRFDLDPNANRMAISVRSAPQRLASDYFGPWTNVRGGIIGWPTGAGKTVAIHTIAKNYRHEEVSMPSPRRPAADPFREPQKRICFIVTEVALVKDVMKDVWVQADTNASKIVELITRDPNLKLQASLVPSAFSSVNVLSARRMTNLIAGRGELGRKLWAGLDPQDPRDAKIGVYPTAPNAYYRYQNPDGSSTWARNRLPHSLVRDAIPPVTRLNVMMPLTLTSAQQQDVANALTKGFARLPSSWPAWKDGLVDIDWKVVPQQEPRWRFMQPDDPTQQEEYPAARQEQFANELVTLESAAAWDDPPVSESVVSRKGQPPETKTFVYHRLVSFSARHGSVNPVTGKAGRWLDTYTGRTELLPSGKLGKRTVIPLGHANRDMQRTVLPPSEMLQFSFNWKFKVKRGAAAAMTEADWADYVTDTLAEAARGWKDVHRALGRLAAERLLIEPVGIDPNAGATGYLLEEHPETKTLRWVLPDEPGQGSDYNWLDRAVFLVDESHRIFDPAEAPPGEHVNFELFSQALQDSIGLRVFYFSATIDLFAGLGMARTLVPREEGLLGPYPRKNVAQLAAHLPTIRHVSKLNYGQVAEQLGPLFDAKKGIFRGDELDKVGNALKGLFSVTQIANMRDYFAQVRDRRAQRYALPLEHSLELQQSIQRRLSYKRIAAQILYGGDLSVNPPSAYVLGHPEYSAERCLRELILGTDDAHPPLLPGMLSLLHRLRSNAEEHMRAWQHEAKQGCTMSVADDKHGINLYAAALHAAGYTWVTVERRQIKPGSLTPEQQAALEKARRSGTVPKDEELRSVYLRPETASPQAEFVSDFRADFIKRLGPLTTPSRLLVLSDSLIRQTGTLKPPSTLEELRQQLFDNFQLDTRFRFLATGAALSASGIAPANPATATQQERLQFQQLRQLLKGQALYYWPGQTAITDMREHYERVDGPVYSKLITKPRLDPTRPHWFLRKKGADEENPDKFAARSINSELEALQAQWGLPSVLDAVVRLTEFDTHLSDDQRADLLQAVTERWNSPANARGDLARLVLIGGTTTQGFDIKDTLYQNNLDIAKNRTDEIQRSGRYLRRDGMPNITPFEHRQLMITTLQAEWHPRTKKELAARAMEGVEQEEQRKDEDYAPDQPSGLQTAPVEALPGTSEQEAMSSNPTGAVAEGGNTDEPESPPDEYAGLDPTSYQPTVRDLFTASELTAAQEATGRAQRMFTVDFGKVAGEHAVLITFESELPPNAPKRISADDPLPPYAAMRMRYQSPSLAALVRIGTQRFAEFAFDGEYSRAKVDSDAALTSETEEVGKGWLFAPTHWSLAPEALARARDLLDAQIKHEATAPAAPLSDEQLLALVSAPKRQEIEEETIQAKEEDGDWAGYDDAKRATVLRAAVLRYAKKQAPAVSTLTSPLAEKKNRLQLLIDSGAAIPLYRRLAAAPADRALFYTLGKGKTPTKRLDLELLGISALNVANAGGPLGALRNAQLVQLHLDITSVASDAISSSFYKRKERQPQANPPTGGEEEEESVPPAKRTLPTEQSLDFQQFFCKTRCVQVGDPLGEEEELEEVLIGVPRSNVLEAADFPDQEQNALEKQALDPFIQLMRDRLKCWEINAWRPVAALIDFAEQREAGARWESVVADFEDVRDLVYAKLTGLPKGYPQHRESTLLRLKIAIIELYKYGIMNWRRAFGILAAVYLSPRVTDPDDLEAVVRLIGSVFYFASDARFVEYCTGKQLWAQTSPLNMVSELAGLCFQWAAVYSPDDRYPTLNGPLPTLLSLLNELHDTALLDVDAQYAAITDAIFTNRTRSGNVVKVSALPKDIFVVLGRLLAVELNPIPRSDTTPIWPQRKQRRPKGPATEEEGGEEEEEEEEEEEAEAEEGFEPEEPVQPGKVRKAPVRKSYSGYGRWLLQLVKLRSSAGATTALAAKGSVFAKILDFFGFDSTVAGLAVFAKARALKQKFEALATWAGERTEPTSGVLSFMALWQQYSTVLPQGERSEHLAALFRQGPGRNKSLQAYQTDINNYNVARQAYAPTGFERKRGAVGDWQALWRATAFPHDWVYLSPSIIAAGGVLPKEELQEDNLFGDFIAKRVVYTNPAISLPAIFIEKYTAALHQSGALPAEDVTDLRAAVKAAPSVFQTFVQLHVVPKGAGKTLAELRRRTQQSYSHLLEWMTLPAFEWTRLERVMDAIAFVLPGRVPAVLHLVSGADIAWLWRGTEKQAVERALLSVINAPEERAADLAPTRRYLGWLHAEYAQLLQGSSVMTEIVNWIFANTRELAKEREELAEEKPSGGEEPPKQRSAALERAKDFQANTHAFFKDAQSKLQARISKQFSARFAVLMGEFRTPEPAAATATTTEEPSAGGGGDPMETDKPPAGDEPMEF